MSLKRFTTFSLSLVVMMLLTGSVEAQNELSEINVYPENIDLSNSRDNQKILVQARFANGLTEDVTEQATLTVGDANVVTLSGSEVFPKADGETQVTVAFGGKQVILPTVVKDSAADPALSFKNDIMPIFMKANCNTGSCHGAARGKDGFRLSLFGFDPNGDHYRITREISGRRINLAFTTSSLLMEKGAGEVPHTGGS